MSVIRNLAVGYKELRCRLYKAVVKPALPCSSPLTTKRHFQQQKRQFAMRILRSSLLTSLLVVVKGSSLNEAMAKIKNDAGFKPKEPRKHKTDTKVGLHLDNLLAVSAPPSAPSTYLRTAHPQHNRLSTPAAPSAPSPSAPSAHPQHPQHTPSAPLVPSAPFSSCTCWDPEPSATVAGGTASAPEEEVARLLRVGREQGRRRRRR